MTAEPTPARLPPQERREQILQSAIRLFEERPHTSVSTAEIAAEAGVARPLIHHYFGTRRDLYIEVLRQLYFIPPIEPAELPGNRFGNGPVTCSTDGWPAWPGDRTSG